jgi:hypothetical protein
MIKEHEIEYQLLNNEIDFSLEILPDDAEDIKLISVDFDIDFKWENDGIGSYEYWGQQCNDKGTDYVILNAIEWNKSKHSNQENEIIQKWLDSTEFEKICEIWENDYANECRDDGPDGEPNFDNECDDYIN